MRVLIFVLVAVLLFLFLNLPAILRDVFPLRYGELISRLAQQSGVDPLLLAAMIASESSFEAEAVSPKGAVGLMQLMPDTARWLAERRGENPAALDLKDPETNIKMGAIYLKYLLELYPTRHAAVAAYNGGPANVDRWLEGGLWDGSWERTSGIPFGETRAFVRKVELMRRIFSFLYQERLHYGEEPEYG